MGRDGNGRKVDNEIINRYFERAVSKHECIVDPDREVYSPRPPRRSYSGQNLSRNEGNIARHSFDIHHNADPHDDSPPSVATHPCPPPYPPPGGYPVAAVPGWIHPSGAPYPVWQPAAPARQESRTNPIPPPPPPGPPPPPPPPPPVWPSTSPSGSGEGSGSEPGKGELHDLLVAWYWAGYHAGMFAAGQKSGK